MSISPIAKVTSVWNQKKFHYYYTFLSPPLEAGNYGNLICSCGWAVLMVTGNILDLA